MIYLASQSPRRRELLKQIGVSHILLLADEQEDAEALEAEIPGEAPCDYVRRVCLAKADAAWQRWQRRALAPAPILSADTTVALGDTILGKPRDATDAADMLRHLSGRRHEVFTAVALVVPTSTASHSINCALSRTEVTFAPLDAHMIDEYVRSQEPFGKAGAYGIQGRAARFVAHLNGSYSGVMGLPLYETTTLLRDAGVRNA